MNRNIGAIGAIALLLSIALRPQFSLAGNSKAQDKTGTTNGIYCLDRKTDDFDYALFAEIHKADGNLLFALDVVKDGFTYWAYGMSRKMEANHWRFTDSDPDFKDLPDAKCTIDITSDQKNWVIIANPDTPCTTHRGERAPYQAPPFPLKSYVGPVPKNVVDGPREAKIGDNLQIMANAGSGRCSFYKRPYKQPYTTSPSPASSRDVTDTPAAQTQIAPTEQTPETRSEIAAKVHHLKDSDLKKIIAWELYGERDDGAPGRVSLDFTSKDDIVLGGISYPLIFVDSDEPPHWSFYKPYLPKQAHESFAAKPTDEQVLARLQTLTTNAKQKFEKLEAKAYEANQEKFRKRYPGSPEETVRASVRGSYEYDDNGDIAPDAQRAYNEYAALEEVSRALDFYIKFKKDLPSLQ